MENREFDYFKIKDYFKEIDDKPAILILGEESDKTPEITIAIPTFKRPSTLKESIDSVINQAGVHDYDIIIVDNNPERDDDTERIMRQYAGVPNLRYYKNAHNLGMGGNWSRCYQLAKSEWVVLLHDDDLLNKYYLDEISKCLSDKLDAVSVKMQDFEDGMSPATDMRSDKPITLRKMSLKNWFLFPEISPSGHIIRRKVMFDLGGFTSKNCPPDIFFVKLLENSRVYRTDKALVLYRRGINDSTNLETMEQMCRLNHDCRLQTWPRFGIPKFVIRQAMLYSDIMFERGVRKVWNDTFRYSEIPQYTKRQYVLSKIFYKALLFWNKISKKIGSKKILIYV